MQDINKKEAFSHPFFLNLLGFVWTRSVSLSGVEKVFKPLKIYIHFLASFLFLVMTDNDWQEESNPLSNHSSLRYSEIIIGDIPLSFLK